MLKFYWTGESKFAADFFYCLIPASLKM